MSDHMAAGQQRMPVGARRLSHIVWDWNGTLLDDASACVEAASRACQLIADITVDKESYRQHFTRPLRLFYERLIGRAISESEWHRIVDEYHSHYGTASRTVGLRPGTDEVLRWVADLGITQSLLSMAEHTELMELIERHGLGQRFLLVHGGQPSMRTESKQKMLLQHLEELARLRGEPLHPEALLLIGDTHDDADAAAHVGAACVLLADGLYDRSAKQLSFSVAKDLRAAVEAGLRMGGAPRGDDVCRTE